MSLYKTETISLMEPMLLRQNSPQRAELTNLAFKLAGRASGFRGSLSEAAQTAVAETVRGMNCYYSNLIEGHNTHPISIESALRKDFSAEPKKRNLQLEAKAHIEVQRWLDDGGIHQRETTAQSIREIHHHFCTLLPPELRKVEDPESGEILEAHPGEFRTTHVKVGEHIPIAAEKIPEFLRRFEEVYNPLSDAESILAAAAAHHRLLWIHPFLDGNGRVARLMSHAVLTRRLESGSLWSIARGLARNVEKYKALLHNCDLQRKGDLDGRSTEDLLSAAALGTSCASGSGNLSEDHLATFTQFFLETCRDQIEFMEGLLKPKELSARILVWAREEIAAERLPEKAVRILEVLLYKGELLRSETDGILGVGDRQARRIVAELEKTGAIGSESPRSPFRLRFPYKLSIRWLPGLYPELPPVDD